MSRSKKPWLIASGCGCAVVLTAAVVVVLVLPGLLAPDFATEGGQEVVFAPPHGESPDEEDRDLLERTLAVQRSRVDDFGAPAVQLEIVDGSIVARIPGSYDTGRLVDLLATRYRLEWYELAGLEPTPQNLTALPPGALPLYSRDVDPITGQELSSEPFLVRSQPFLGNEHVEDAEVELDQFNEPFVRLTFTPEGRRIFCDVTTSSVQKRLPIVLDGIVNSAPIVNEPICGGRAAITLGQLSREQLRVRAEDLAFALRAGALPVDLTVTSTRTVGPAG